MYLSESLVKCPVLWLVVFVLITVIGVYLFWRIAVDLFPEIDVPAVNLAAVIAIKLVFLLVGTFFFARAEKNR